ncbi:MAG: methyltransferase domain-containing protein, partial [Betaproteobacteria bacterium]|nr:methyltransferase domain-containing protein [Betaproteobacteria bacterium]
MTWNPAQYLQFEGERLRPALDLLARVPLASPRTIVDLGCGAANVTRVLGERWPDARITGVDNSAEMLAAAQEKIRDDGRYSFVAADLATWQPDAPIDLVYSNAALQWLDDHARLFPRIAAMVAAGGVLAVQMPNNHAAPSHTASIDLARSDRWRPKLKDLVRTRPVADSRVYYTFLAPHFATVDIWENEYLQVLPPRVDGDHPVVAWTKGTWLAPFLAALDTSERTEFLRDYTQRMVIAYPPEPDGCTLFPFRRKFIVATL